MAGRVQCGQVVDPSPTVLGFPPSALVVLVLDGRKAWAVETLESSL